MESRICQSCGMPLPDDRMLGTLAGGEPSREYCKYCMSNGEFRGAQDFEGKLEACVALAVPDPFPSAEAARAALREQFRRLKRWNPLVMDKPEMTLAGTARTAPGYEHIAPTWEDYMRVEDAIPGADRACRYEHHMSAGEDGQMRCFVGVPVADRLAAMPEGVTLTHVPAARYAVFTWRMGDGGFGGAYAYIRAWAQDSQLSVDHSYDVQAYDARFTGIEKPDAIVEIWIPLL